MGRAYRPSSEPVEKVIEPDPTSPGRVYNTPAANEVTGAPDPQLPVIEHDGIPPFDPAEHTADEVHEYLATADDAERDRVLSAEAGGKARKGVLEAKQA